MGLPWTAALLASTSWIIYRVYQVFQKPVEELEETLGIDTPPAPNVSLSVISSTSLLLFWKQAEQYASQTQCFIQVNGVKVNAVERSSPMVHISNLQPGHHYSIRAVATTDAGHASFSRFIQVQTPFEDGAAGAKILRAVDTTSARTPHPQDPQSQLHATQREDDSLSDADEDKADGQDSVTALRRKLDALRMQKEEADDQLAQAMADAHTARVQLAQERDDLKAAVETREKAALDFKRQVSELDKQSKAAQRRKSAKERIFQQRRSDRQRLQSEASRFELEGAEIRVAMQRLRSEQEDCAVTHRTKLNDARRALASTQAESRALEEGVQDWGRKIKALETNRRKADQAHSAEEEAAERHEQTEEQSHEVRMQELQGQYASLWKLASEADAELQRVQERLNTMMQLQAHDWYRVQHGSSDMPDSSRRVNRVEGSSPWYPTLHGSGPLAARVARHGPLSASSSFPFYGAQADTPALADFGLRPHEAEHLTGGAQMSPTANNLLPSDLLGDDDLPSEHDMRSAEGGAGMPSLPLHRITTSDASYVAPASPLSAHSHSPSIVSSPRDSLRNVQRIYSGPEHMHEISPKASLVSAESPYLQSAALADNSGNARRMAALFGFNRQRGKAGSLELPTLGSLGANQTQSFPTKFDEVPGSKTSPRRKLSSGVWANPLPNFLLRGHSHHNNGLAAAGRPGGSSHDAKADSLEDISRGAVAATTFEGTVSPRPSSTYSYDYALGQSSGRDPSLGLFGTSAIRARGGPQNSDWTSPTNWPDAHSRHSSLHLGSTSNVSLTSASIDTDGGSTALTGRKAFQPAPIGTERLRLGQRKAESGRNPSAVAAQTSAKAATTGLKLNPNAPSFTTRLFSRGPETRKVSKTDEKSRSKESSNGLKVSDNGADAQTPVSEEGSTHPRRSRDNHSVLTATSVATDSSTTDLAESSTLSDAGSPAGSTPGAARESLMQRLTRKSSSSKFGMSWKERSGGLGRFGKKGAGAGAAGSAGDLLPSTPDDSPGLVTMSWEHGSDTYGSSALGSPAVRSEDTDRDTAAREGESDQPEEAGKVSREEGRERERERIRASRSWSRVMRKNNSKKAREGEEGESEDL